MKRDKCSNSLICAVHRLKELPTSALHKLASVATLSFVTPKIVVPVSKIISDVVVLLLFKPFRR